MRDSIALTQRLKPHTEVYFCGTAESRALTKLSRLSLRPERSELVQTR